MHLGRVNVNTQRKQQQWEAELLNSEGREQTGQCDDSCCMSIREKEQNIHSVPVIRAEGGIQKTESHWSPERARTESRMPSFRGLIHDQGLRKSVKSVSTLPVIKGNQFVYP